MDDQRTDRAGSGMKYRKLRIAFSITCGIASVLLVVLWVRSFWHCDAVYRITPSTIQTTIGSNWGSVYFSQLDITLLGPGAPTPRGWTYQLFQPSSPGTIRLAFWENRAGIIQAGVSHWLMITPAAVLAAAPWIRWRFSLRTLLISITLVAALFGLIVWAAK
jgi:hypothetical protein